MDKKRFVCDSINRAFGMYAFSSVSTLVLASLVRGNDVGLSLTRTAVLLVFSLLFGFSFAVFNINGASSTTKRMLHVALVLVMWVPTFLLMGTLKEGASQTVMGIVVACLIYLAVYPLMCLAAMLWRKIIK